MTIGPDGKPCFSFPVTGMDAHSVRSDISLQRRVLQMLAQHVWLAAMPSVHDIADLIITSDTIIH